MPPSLSAFLLAAWHPRAPAAPDLAAASLIAVGLGCQFFSHRMRPGLGTSLFVGLTTFAVAMLAANHQWRPAYPPYFRISVTALLTLLWACLGWLAARSRRAELHQAALSDSSTFFAWALVIGLAVAVQLVYNLVFITSALIFDPDLLEDATSLPSSRSFWDILGLLGATLFWLSRGRRPHQPVMLLVLSALLVWWASLMIPLTGSAEQPILASAADPTALDWTFHLHVGLAALLLLAATLQEIAHRARRRRAWPDRLEDLLHSYSDWPAYVPVESAIAAIILILGVYQVVRLASGSPPLMLVSLLASMTAGWTCLFMSYRRWSPNSAGLGMALLTLAIVHAASLVAMLLTPNARWADYSLRIPILFNAVLFGLALMILWWRWLARFWRQQLLDGQAWTTTGRMIPYARRTAFLLSALAVLIAFHMAFWPNVAPTVEDDGPARIGAGLAAILLLGLINARKAHRDDSVTSATLAVALLIAAIIFLFIRLPTSALRGWLKQYDEVVLGAIALPTLLLAEFLPKTSWRCFTSPLWLLALLLLPAIALAGLLSRDQPEEWIRPMTLAILGALYSFAGSREHRRAFLALGGMLLLASLTTLYRAYGPAIMNALSG